MRLTVIVAFIVIPTLSVAQTTFEAVIKDAQTHQPLPGATANIRALGMGASANEDGLVRLENVPSGKHRVEFPFVGYATLRIELSFPLESPQPFEVRLQPEHEQLEEIVISSTRESAVST